VDNGGSSSYYVNQVKGELDQILVKNDQKVNAGDVLFTYKNSEAEDSMYDKQAELARVRIELQNARAALTDAQRTGDPETIRQTQREVSANEVEVNQ